MKNTIIYIYIAVLFALELVSVLVVTFNQGTIGMLGLLGMLVIIALLITAPIPKAKAPLPTIRVYGETLTVDGSLIIDAKGMVVLNIEDTDFEGITDLSLLERELEGVLQYDYQDNKG